MKRKAFLKRPRPRAWQPRFEPLEDRRLLAVITVTNLLDAGTGSLRAAIAQANAMADADTIEFQSGLSGTIPVTTGELSITDDVVVDGTGATIVLDATGAASRAFNVDDGDDLTKLIVTLEQLTIQGADVSTGVLPSVFGGGIRNSEDLTLSSATVTGNSADNGGGIANLDGGRLTILNSQVDGNSALNRGGGIYNGANGVLVVTNSDVDQNDAADLGGGILIGSASQATITNSSIDDNTSIGRGGGLYIGSFGTGVAANVTITGESTISRNVGDDGGGLMIGSGVTVNISDSALEQNHSLDRGGAIHISGFSSPNISLLDLQNVQLLGNIADDDGGGIHAGTSSSVTITDSNVDSNSAASRGGGINVSGFASAFTANMSITGSTISGNSTMDDGGGIHAASATVLTLIDSEVADNYAYDRGSGLRVSGFGNTTFPNVTTIQSSIISGNSSNDAGAGIYSGSATTTTIENSSIVNNVSAADAGGLAVLFGGTTVIQKSTIANNTATGDGGGIDLSDSNLSISDSTISGNTSGVGGSGLHSSMDQLTSTNYPVAIDRSTIVNNSSTSDYGGGVYLQFTEIKLTGSIVSGNLQGVNEVDLYDYTAGIFSGTTVSYSLIGNNAFSDLVESSLDSNGNIIGGPLGGSVNPMLSPLSNNGGLTLTHLPAPTSPAINAGNPAANSGTDQRGLPRISGGRVDMGSVELQQAVDGDFNDDGLYDCLDVNQLSAAIAAGLNPSAFDLTQDGFVNQADLMAWLSEAGEINLGPDKAYLPADANLSGNVDGADFLIWNSNKFTANDAFCSGDFNADGNVDGADFLIWNSDKFTSSDAVVARVQPVKRTPPVADVLQPEEKDFESGRVSPRLGMTRLRRGVSLGETDPPTAAPADRQMRCRSLDGLSFDLVEPFHFFRSGVTAAQRRP